MQYEICNSAGGSDPVMKELVMATSEFNRHESGQMVAITATGNLQAAIPIESATVRRLMPWVLSVLLHLGVAMIAMFIGLVAVHPPGANVASIPIGDFLPNSPPDNPAMSPSLATAGSDILTGSDDRGAKGKMPSLWAEHRHEMNPTPRESVGLVIPIIGLTDQGNLKVKVGEGKKYVFGNIGPMRGPNDNGDGGGGGDGDTGIRRPGGGFSDIIFVIDRSGSMIQNFDALKSNMLRTISLLDESRRFDVIMFSDGAPLENGMKRLAPADEHNKTNVARFMNDVVCAGQTDPLPAIRRAFEVAKESGSGRTAAILLLTDAAFPDNTKVEQLVAELNCGKKVHVYTYVYGLEPPDEQTQTVMKRIARNNKGLYKYVCPN
jgi:hypothetical protein